MYLPFASPIPGKPAVLIVGTTVLLECLVAAAFLSFVESAPPLPVFGYRVVKVLPHDPEAFTQGLAFHRGFMYEGTGLQGRSKLRQVDIESGRVLREVRLPQDFFGEGITLWKETIIQLTWQNRIGLVYDLSSFQLLKHFSYPWEGWGLTQDGRHLILSDGSSYLHFLDPESFREVRRVRVEEKGRPIRGLNELEYVGGEVFANVYPTDWIVRIAPKDGRVLGWIDLSGLRERGDDCRGTLVLNGIAYDPQEDRLWVTGKHWSKMFEIKLVPPGR